MEPISWVLLAVGLVVGAAAGGGGVAAVHAVQDNRTALALAESQAAFAEQQSEQLRAALAPLQLEAESDANVYDKLTDTPVSCVAELGGSPLSLQCRLDLCWAAGLQDKQRPECGKLLDLYVDRIERQDACQEATL